MSTPHTRPGELSRIKELAGDDPYRTEVLIGLAVLRDRSEQTINWQRGTDEWRANHDKEDAERFVKHSDRMDRLEKDYTGVRSGVNAYNEDKQQLKGAKRLALLAIAVAAGMGALITWLISILHEFRGNP